MFIQVVLSAHTGVIWSFRAAGSLGLERSKVAGSVSWFSEHAGDEKFSYLIRCFYSLVSETFGNLTDVLLTSTGVEERVGFVCLFRWCKLFPYITTETSWLGNL